MPSRKHLFYAVLLVFITVLIYYRYFLIAILSIVSSALLPLDLNYVKENQWVYDSGFKIREGDFIEFKKDDSMLQLKGDTVYFEGKPRALITETNTYLYQMKISSIDGKQKGVYANVLEFTH